MNTTTDFVLNATTSKIDLTRHTSNYVSRVNSELTTALSGKATTSHTHTTTQITVLDIALGRKQNNPRQGLPIN
jgi:hypothetical protein